MITLLRRLLGKHKKQSFVEHQYDATPIQWVKHYPLFEKLPRKSFEPDEQVTMVRTARNTWVPITVDWNKDKEKKRG